jgi:valyl-tRNA synthetase
MDLRPQSHEIIRTWLFATVVRSHLEHRELPWRHAAISGWILDPDRKKMSKSRGNVVTPVDLLTEFSSDGVRYWAASGRPGVDTAFDVAQMKIGRRLAIKLLNASKFVLSIGAPSGEPKVTSPLDRAMVAELAAVIQDATVAFDRYDYSRALERTERFFWFFCDDYLELVKIRAYGQGGQQESDSARTALATALSSLLRLFAPFLPFVTEEAWSWWQAGSVHRASWPDPKELNLAGHADPGMLTIASQAISDIRKAKSDAKVSMRAEVRQVILHGPADVIDRVQSVANDIQAAGNVRDVQARLADVPQLVVDVLL